MAVCSSARMLPPIPAALLAGTGERHDCSHAGIAGGDGEAGPDCAHCRRRELNKENKQRDAQRCDRTGQAQITLRRTGLRQTQNAYGNSFFLPGQVHENQLITLSLNFGENLSEIFIRRLLLVCSERGF